MGCPGGVTRGGKWGGSRAAKPQPPLSWTPGSASVLKVRPGSDCVGAAQTGIGGGRANEDPREARSVHTTLRVPGWKARRRFERAVR